MIQENFKLEVNVSEVTALFKSMQLTTNEARRALRSGLNESSRLIRNQARRNLSRVYCKNGQLDASTLRTFVRCGVRKDLRGALISISPYHSKRYKSKMKLKGVKDKAFLLRFFEEGTNVRHAETYTRVGIKKRLKKPRNTGYIVASHFFSDAVSQKAVPAKEKLQSYIEKHIRRIAKKHNAVG